VKEGRRKTNVFSFSLDLDLLSLSRARSLAHPLNLLSSNTKQHSDVRLLAPVHALRLGDQAQELPSFSLPRQQRVRAAQPDAAVVGGRAKRRLVSVAVVVSFTARRRRSFRVKETQTNRKQ